MARRSNLAAPRDCQPVGHHLESTDPYVWKAAFVVVLGSVMVGVDATVVNVALDPLTDELDTGLARIQWIVTGYLLAIAAVIPLTGWAARRFSPRRVFMWSVALFTASSALCGLASSAEQLIVFRVLQGVGGGAIPPVGQMILVSVAGRERLPQIMGTLGIPTVLAPVFAPTLGGLLVEFVSWRWIFFVNVPIGLLAIVAGRRLLPSEPAEREARVDAFGLLLIAVGLVGLTYGLSAIEDASDTFRQAIVPIAAGAMLIAAFVVRSLRTNRPLLDMRVYADKVFSGAAVATFFLGATLVTTSILMPLYLQSVRGQDAMGAGLLTSPRAVGAAFGTWLSSRLVRRFGTGRTALVGSIGITIFTAPYVALDADSAYVYIIVVGALQGFAMGISMMPTMAAAYRSLRSELVPDASPQLSILSRVGSSVGVAVLLAILQRQLTGATSADDRANAFATTFVWLVLVVVPGMLAAAMLMMLEIHDARAVRRSLTVAPEASSTIDA